MSQRVNDYKVNPRNALPVIGIDISKKTFDAALSSNSKNYKHKQFANNLSGFSDLLNWYHLSSQERQGIFVIEATGTYHEKLTQFLFQQEQTVSIVNPSQTSNYAKSLGLKAKTDKVDAQMLARYGSERELKLWNPPSEEILQLNALLKQISILEKNCQREQNRLEALDHASFCSTSVRKTIESVIVCYQEQLELLKNEIEELIQENPQLKKDRQYLLSIPGIGKDTAHWLLSVIQQKGRFDSARQLVAYTGLNPTVHQSGTSVNRCGPISKRGNPILRTKLYFPTMSAIQHNPIIRVFYKKLISQKKCGAVALIASMRKLLHIAFGVIQNQMNFDPHFQRND